MFEQKTKSNEWRDENECVSSENKLIIIRER